MLVRGDHPATGAGGTLALDAGSETVLDILPNPQRGAFTKEDGEPVVDAAGRRTGARSTSGKRKSAGDRNPQASVHHRVAPIAAKKPPRWRLPRWRRFSRDTIPGQLNKHVEMSGEQYTQLFGISSYLPASADVRRPRHMCISVS